MTDISKPFTSVKLTSENGKIIIVKTKISEEEVLKMKENKLSGMIWLDRKTTTEGK